MLVGGGGIGVNSGGTGSGDDDATEISIVGNEALEVLNFIYDETEYPDAESLVNALRAKESLPDTFEIEFNVPIDGDVETRIARVTANGKAGDGIDLLIEYQYKFSCDSPPINALFYKNDGVSVVLPQIAETDFTEQGGVEYHAKKWNILGQAVSGGNVKIYPSGEVNIGTIGMVPDTSYGFSTGGGLVINQTSGTITVKTNGSTNASGGITEIILPDSGSIALDLSQVTSFNVSSIQNNKSSLNSVILPDSASTISSNLFESCISLTSINLSNCTSIGDSAFAYCGSLTSVDLSNCTSIGAGAFLGTGLTSVTFGSGLSSIGDQAFFGSNCRSYIFNNDPTAITYNSSVFPSGSAATWNNNGTIKEYAWNLSLKAWVEK